MGIKAIETIYNGYRFRSRLEARWAVFFDALRIEYQYEPEGYDLGEAGWYLPDFWLPQVSMFAEVKPREFTEEELFKCYQLALQSGFAVLVLDGMPEQTNYWAFIPCRHNEPWGWENQEPKYPGTYVMDYLLHDDNQYWLHENRFFADPGLTCNTFEHRFDDWIKSELGGKAVSKARQARFCRKDD